jgi:hypothetical protein
MPYWGPPPISSYDPSPRPLRWEWRDVEIRGQNVRVRWPSAEDAAYFGTGLDDVRPLKTEIRDGVELHPQDLHSQPEMPFVLPGVIGHRRGNGNVTFSGALSPYERLLAYNRIAATRAPEDPESGGLPADSTDGAEIRIHYFDLSDKWAKRKMVAYSPKSGGVNLTIKEWYPERGAWDGEGFDFERDFSNALPDILHALQVTSSMVVAYLTANPTLAAAWGSAFGEGARGALTGKPPSLEAAFGTLVTAGRSVDLPVLLRDEIAKSDVLSALNGAVVRTVGADAIERLAKVGKTFSDVLPKIDLPSLLGAVPREILSNDGPGAMLFGSVSLDFAKAMKAAMSGDITEALSIRKTVADLGVFDLAFASAIAFQKDYVERIASASASSKTDPGARSFRQVLGTPAAELASEQRAKSFEQTMGRNVTIFATRAAPPSSKKVAAGIGALAGFALVYAIARGVLLR